MLAVNIEDPKPIDAKKLKPDRAYSCKVAMGPRQRFRRLPAGRWIKKEEDSSGRVTLEMQAGIGDIESMSYSTFMGLVEAHNQFLAANKSKEIVQGTNSQKNPARTIRENVQSKEDGPLYKGDVNRMIVILEFAETDKPPTDGPRDQFAVLRAFAKEFAKEFAPQFAAALADGLKK